MDKLKKLALDDKTPPDIRAKLLEIIIDLEREKTRELCAQNRHMLPRRPLMA